MSFFSWFNTNNLPQSSVKKQIIDQSGHFLIAFVLFAIMIFGIHQSLSLPIVLFGQIIWMAVLYLTKTSKEYSIINRVLFNVLPFNFLMVALTVTFVYSLPIALPGILGGFVLGYSREIYQHNHFGISKGSALDIVFFVIGGLVSLILFFT